MDTDRSFRPTKSKTERDSVGYSRRKFSKGFRRLTVSVSNELCIRLYHMAIDEGLSVSALVEKLLWSDIAKTDNMAGRERKICQGTDGENP